MADQLLSIQDSSLEEMATAIKNKCGINTSTKLLFPGDAATFNSFFGALKNTETEVTITPKIAAQQKILTPASPSFSITPGFHNGKGTVAINTQSKTVTPSAEQQIVVPDENYFLSSVLVKAIGAGKQVATGTFTASGTASVEIPGFNQFNPEGIAGFIINHSNVKKDRTVAFQSIIVQDGYKVYANVTLYGSSAGLRSGVATKEGYFNFSNQTITINFQTSSNSFYGTYFYVVWGG